MGRIIAIKGNREPKKIIISFTPLPSYKNHNMNYDLELLKEREEYAKQVAEKFEEMMNYDR